ncbi:hypothetical protein CCM_07558 [Cordyceps militaris CM01]|uniref:Uncharacterized protein n=1 Tax=Cordyceps militaris (strain CM01) TaxID=983644 RepID=G3JQ56_CORMM|nr:uncharacterized protein CCM_07558 [Cordyceps militaris CM01]EGX89307.1 hypothetical protein CCM_07558 [Cordyceps militaris CM01]
MNDGVILAMLAMAPCFNSVSARFSSSPTLAVHPILDDPGLAPAKRQGWHHHSRRNFEQGLSRDHGQIVADRYERWLPAYPKRIEIRPRFIQDQLAPNLGNWKCGSRRSVLLTEYSAFSLAPLAVSSPREKVRRRFLLLETCSRIPARPHPGQAFSAFTAVVIERLACGTADTMHTA